MFIAKPLKCERIGLNEIDEGIWSVWFMSHFLGQLDVRTMKITYLPV